MAIHDMKGTIVRCVRNLNTGLMTVSDVYSKYTQGKMIELLKGLIKNYKKEQHGVEDDLEILATVLCVSLKLGDEEYHCKKETALDFSKELIELYSEETFSLTLY